MTTRDREKVGLLTDKGLMTDWTIVKRVCSHFDKRWEWNDAGVSAAGPTTGKRTEEIPTRSEETRMQLKSGPVLNMVEGPSGGAAFEELTKMVRDL